MTHSVYYTETDDFTNHPGEAATGRRAGNGSQLSLPGLVLQTIYSWDCFHQKVLHWARSLMDHVFGNLMKWNFFLQKVYNFLRVLHINVEKVKNNSRQ